MTPTREQFKEFIAAEQKAQQKEENLNKALKLIWDDAKPSTSCLDLKMMNMLGTNSPGGWRRHLKMRQSIGLMIKITTSAMLTLFMISWLKRNVDNYFSNSEKKYKKLLKLLYFYKFNLLI